MALVLGCGDASVCGEGLEQRGGSCVPVCVEGCGEHQGCVAVDSQAECQCVAGYEGDPCEWTGALEDPEFTIQEAWPGATHGASILPLASGPTGQGIASFQSSVVCNAGSVSQVVEMPSYELADQFIIETTYRSEKTGGVAVGYNRAFRRLEDTNGLWVTQRVCLGEAGYGGPVKFQVAAAGRRPDCFSQPEGIIEVDRMQILVAEPGECPAPGIVLNGEANEDEGGWFFDEEEDWAPGFGVDEAGFVPGSGNSGSSGARVYKEAGGSNLAAMGTKVSVSKSETMPSPALRFWWKGTSGTDYRVELGTYERAFITSAWDTLVADGDAHTYTYCLPPWTHGNVVQLAFFQERTDEYLDMEGELIVDDVELFSDPECGDAEDLLDPSFDAAPNRWPHVQLARSPSNAVELVNDPDLARPPGDGGLALTYQNEVSLVAMGMRVWIPPSEGAKGPMLVFHSNVPVDASVPVRWLLGNSGILTAELLLGGGWRRNEVCLPPEWAERWFRFGVSAFVAPGVLLDTPERVLLDDFELTTDESCPPN